MPKGGFGSTAKLIGNPTFASEGGFGYPRGRHFGNRKGVSGFFTLKLGSEGGYVVKK